MKKIFTLINIFVFLILATTGCYDDFDMKRTPIGEGKGYVTATVDFKPMTSTLTRSSGKALNDIHSLYVLLYSIEDESLIKKWEITDYETSEQQRTDDDAAGDKTAETSTLQATFQLPDEIEFGRYYMYAVANVPNFFSNYADQIGTVSGLKSCSMDWDASNISNNGEMFGYGLNTAVEAESEALIVNSQVVNVHFWLQRLASKVTIAYDGSNLKDGVMVYFTAATIHNIPRSCMLAEANHPSRSIQDLYKDGETHYYFEGPNVVPEVLSGNYPAYVSNQPDHQQYGSDHAEDSEALYFYENLQGKGKDKRPQKDENGNLIYVEHDNEHCGTYIEVDGYYVSTNPERRGHGMIKYRFMLGKDIIDDYNAERNHHYKLTLRLKNFANDYDWHIEYQEKVFTVTEPKVMNYQGKVFEPEYRMGTEHYNFGHNFGENEIFVTCFMEDENHEPAKWTVEYADGDSNNFSSDFSKSWIEPVIEDGYLPYVKKVTLKTKEPDMTPVDINDVLSKTSAKSNNKDKPFNLADPDQGAVSPNSATICCTANSYIVDAPGYYILPLIYGNAMHNRQKNESAYHFTGTESDTGGKNLTWFKDHKGREIKSPNIKTYSNPASAFLIWQDVNNLVKYDTWNNHVDKDIEYLPNAYGGIGGIRFYIETAKQGNAVIGLSEAAQIDLAGKVQGNLPDVIWSWHIWVTTFNYLEKSDRNLVVTGDNGHEYKFLPTDLGWCSDDGDKILYYKGRKGKLKFKTGTGTNEKVIIYDIEQKSHIAYTRGNTTFYQWGRKDPFVGSKWTGGNKTMYWSINWDGVGDHLTLSKVFENNKWEESEYTDAYTTIGAVDAGLLVNHPDKWHNPKRRPSTESNLPFKSYNKMYFNLWQGQAIADAGSPGFKTIYDPCPIGYQVPSLNAVSGFTTTGDDTNTEFEWYDVRKSNVKHWIDKVWQDETVYSWLVYEFYTNSNKVQSITFPSVGYRDWINGSVFHWDPYATDPNNKPIGYIWLAQNYDDVNAYNFEFSHLHRVPGYVRPRNYFYNNDGFPVRPCVNETHPM